MSKRAFPERLRGERFATGRTLVVDRSPAFCDRSGKVSEGSKAEEDLKAIIKLLGAGSPLPDRFYRNLVGNGDDLLLEEWGIKHLHLGGSTTDILLFVVEYEDRALLLEINGHEAFAQKPVGSVLRRLHQNALNKADVAASTPKSADPDAVTAKPDLKAGLKGPRRTTASKEGR